MLMQPFRVIQGNDQAVSVPRVFTVEEIRALATGFANSVDPDESDLVYRLLLSNFILWIGEQDLFQRKRAEFDFENVWRRLKDTEWADMKAACKHAYDAGRGAQKFEMNKQG